MKSSKFIVENLKKFIKDGYKPVWNWTSPITISPFKIGTFELVQYSMIKDGKTLNVIFQVYSTGKVIEYLNN